MRGIHHEIRATTDGLSFHRRRKPRNADRFCAGSSATGFLRPLLSGLSQTDACATAIFVDELDAGGFERLTYDLKCRAPWLMYSSLELTNRDNPDAGLFSQLLLAPIK